MSRYLPDFSGVFCLTIFIVILLSTNDALLRDGDTFWHIKVGTVMLEQQSLLDSDIFSHTAYGTPWTAHEWLAEIIMAGIHKLAGLEGLFCFFALLISLSFWILYKITEKDSTPLITLACLTIPLAYCQSHLAARPHVFTWLLMLTTLAIIKSNDKHLYWLPAITLIWANLHGGFILGIVLQGIYILGHCLDEFPFRKKNIRECIFTQKRPIIVLCMCVLAVGFNPFGYELLLFPFQVSKGVFSDLIGEWTATDLLSMWHFAVYLFAFAWLLILPGSSATWTERLLFIFFMLAALTHMRHISIMVMVMTPCLARMLTHYFERWRNNEQNDNDKGPQLQLSAKSGPLVTILITISLLTLGAITPHALNFLSPKRIFNVSKSSLDQLTAYLEANRPRGTMFNEYSLGGYLLYALDYPPKVFIDGRADMYGEQLMIDYKKIISANNERESLLEHYNVDWVVFDKNSTLIRSLFNSGNWEMLYDNQHYAVLTKRSI